MRAMELREKFNEALRLSNSNLTRFTRVALEGIGFMQICDHLVLLIMKDGNIARISDDNLDQKVVELTHQ